MMIVSAGIYRFVIDINTTQHPAMKLTLVMDSITYFFPYLHWLFSLHCELLSLYYIFTQ